MIPFFADLTVGYTLLQGTHSTISSATDTDSSAIDLQDYEGPVHLMYSIGDSGDATTTISIKLRECATSGGTYADITGAAFTLTPSATANDNTMAMLKVDNRSLRYVKTRVTTGVGTPSVAIAVWVLGRKKIGGASGILTTS